jgi:hypothetical protein
MSEVYRVISEDSGGISSDVTVICYSSGGTVSASCEAGKIVIPYLIVDVQRQCHWNQV